MPSVEELLSVAEVDLTGTASAMDNRIEIDADTRIIQMMPQDELFGVESDEKSERKYFKVPKIVGNGVDLSKLQLRINYQNASKIPSGKDMYIVTDATVYNDEWVYFSWELSRKVTLYKGTIYFVVCAVKADSKGKITNEWNTTLAMGKVLEGLEVETSQEQQYQASDYLEMLKQQLLQYSEQIKGTFPSDYTETVENVKNLQSDVKKLDNNKITKFYTSNQGQKVLNDSDDGKIQDLMIYGKSEQKQYKGTNLLPVLKKLSLSYSGVTVITKEDGTMVLNGTSTEQVDYWLVGSYTDGVKYTFDETKKYTIGKMPTGVALLLGANSTTKKTITNSDLVTSGFSFGFILLRCTKGRTFNNVEVKVQMNEGTTLLDYEPYTGGKPSPSPEYPQEIKAVVNPIVKTHGKNLYDSEKYPLIFNKSIDTDTGKIYTSQSRRYYATEKYIPFPYGGKKISFNDSMSLCAYDKDNKFIAKIVQNTHTVPLGTMYVRFDIPITYKDVAQIEFSENATPYQPYQETQATLPYELYAIPVESGGNVTIDGQQYIADYVDAESGKLVKCIGSKTIDGTEIYIHEEGWNNNAFVIYGILKDGVSYANYTDIADIMIDKLVKKSATAIADGGVIGIGSTSRNLFICLGDKYNTSEKIKEYFSFNKTVVYYVLETSTTINLTLEQITAFKALSTYYPKTYISAESEQLEAYTMFNYPVSMEKGWEYVKQQIGDTRKYVYDMETKLTETEASTLEAKIDTAILSEMVGG